MANIQPPAYFEEIKAEAAQLWDSKTSQRERNLGKYLLQQINKIRYVISELLQNADDAGATFAQVRIDGRDFIFEHNGHDFSKEEFGAICNFAVSNKRTCQTIGFRGIGFKSTFSIGDIVYLRTPSLSVYFSKKRFTEPVWVDDDEHLHARRVDELTRISVPIKSDLVEEELLESFNEWKRSNYSLLFFNNLKEIKIERYSFKVIDTRPGPISNSIYLTLDSATEAKNIEVLKISSKPLQPPPEAIEEIRELRNMDEADNDVPPFVIDIILDIPTKQYLYVVLPTLTQTNLGISINASFVLTPDRTMTVEPSQSPTNRWILEEVGNLIVSSLKEWLEKTSLPIEERVEAYKLLQPTNVTEWGDKLVNEAISKYLSKTNVVLDCNGGFQKKCLSVPKDLYSVWERETLLQFYIDAELPIIEKAAIKHLNKLDKWGLVETEEPAKFLAALLKPAHIPRPSTTKQLLLLWECVSKVQNSARSQAIKNRNQGYDFKDENISKYQIFPVLNKQYLYSSEDTMRNCDEFNESVPQKYRNLINSTITFIDPTVDEELDNSRDLLSEKVRHLLEETNKKDNPKIKDLLDELSLYELDDNELITLAHMYMYWDKEVPEDTFEYISSNGLHICLDSETAYYDKHNILSRILPKEKSESKVVSPLYEEYLNSDDEKEKWRIWTLSKKSHIEQPLTLYEKSGDYSLPDDFLQSLDKYYKYNPNGNGIWADCLSLIIETDKNYHQKIYTNSGVAQWVVDFSDKPCIRGNDGNIHLPSEVYWETEVTKLLEGEIFIDVQYQGVAQRLLEELGVRFKPGYPEALIKRLKGLSFNKSTDLETILSIYNKLNAVVAEVDSEVIGRIRSDFKDAKLAYTEKETWETSSNIYRTKAELPRTHCLHQDVNSLSLWAKLSFSSKPTLEDSLDYLRSLQTNSVPPMEELLFIKNFLSSNTGDVLQRVKYWLSIDNHWKRVDDFEHYILDKKGIPGLYQEFKSKIPQLSLINKEQRSYFCSAYFKSAIDIVNEVVWRAADITENTQKPSKHLSWMTAIGRFLLNNVPKDNADYSTLQKLGNQYINTKLLRVDSFYEAPYYKNERIGIGKEGRIKWENNTIYCDVSIRDEDIGIEFSDLIDQNPIVIEISNDNLVKALNYLIDRDDYIIKTRLKRLFKNEIEDEEETKGVFADRHSYENEHADEYIGDKAAEENSSNRYPADFHKKIDESPREAIQWNQIDSLNYSNEGGLQRRGKDNSSADNENTPQFSNPKESDNDIIGIMAGAESINDGYFTLQPNKKTKEPKIQTKRKVIGDIVHRTKTDLSKNGPAINELDGSADYEDFTPNKTIDFSKIIESEKDKSAAKIEEIAHLEELQSRTKEFSKYSYGWFTSLLEMERINSEKEYANSNEITINFGKIVREPGTKRTLILQYPDRYIPQFMEDIADIPLILHIGDKTKKATIEVANIKSYTLRVKLKNPSDIDNIDLESVSQATINARSPLFLIDALMDKISELNYSDGFNMQTNLCKNIEFIFGPPGTGKTTYLATDVIIPLMQEKSDCKVLVLAPTNKSADVLVRRIMEVLKDDLSYNEWLLRFGTTFDEGIEDKQIFKDRTFDISAVSRNVTVTTIARFPYDYFIVDDKRMYLSGINWDFIVIDEASMIPLVNIILPLYMKTPQKFIIAGDPFQIQPITSVDIWKNENIYTLVKLDSFENPKTVPHNYNVKLLTTQYRSIPSIGSIFNNFTYGGILHHARDEESQRKLHINSEFEIKSLNLIKFPVSKYESIYKCKRLKHSSSYQIYSALFTYEYVCYLSQELAAVNQNEPFKIGVIAPYRAQADLISKLVAAEKLPDAIDVNVGTIHGFQGDECDIIFAVFNTPPSISSSNEMFLNNRNIINVAVSRARDYLFIVMPDDNTENISKLVKIKRIEQLIKSSDAWNEVYSPDIERQMFGDSQYLENNVFSTSHQSVNVYGLPEKCYEVRTENDAVDVQVHKNKEW